MAAVGASSMLSIRDVGDEEAHVRDGGLANLLTSQLEESVSARCIRGIHETVRFTAWSTVSHIG